MSDVALIWLIAPRFVLDDIGEAYEIFGERRDSVMKVALKP